MRFWLDPTLNGLNEFRHNSPPSWCLCNCYLSSYHLQFSWWWLPLGRASHSYPPICPWIFSQQFIISGKHHDQITASLSWVTPFQAADEQRWEYTEKPSRYEFLIKFSETVTACWQRVMDVCAALNPRFSSQGLSVWALPVLAGPS